MQVNALNALKGIPHVPVLRGHGRMPDDSPFHGYAYMLTIPVGRHVSSDSPAGEILHVVRAVASVIKAMHQKWLLHRYVAYHQQFGDPCISLIMSPLVRSALP